MSGTITFDDEFDTLSLHRTWQQGDKWQLIAPDSTDGRGGPNWGEGGSQWWVNPYNPNTPINGIYSVSNGMLNIALLPTPSQYQTYINQQAGASMPYVGGLLNTSPTNDQHYGYWDIGMSCDRVPGFACEISLENVQLTGHWPPQINIGVSTDGSGNQTLQAHMYYNNTSSDFSQTIDGTQQHDYAIDWEADYITFYLDNVKVFQVANPGGVYQTDEMFAYLYTGADYSQGTGVNPPVSSLPAYAHVNYFRVYTAGPSVANNSLSIVAANATRQESTHGSTPFTFTVTRSGSTTGTSTAAWAVTGSGGSPADTADFTGHVLPSGTVSFGTGQTTKTITVNVAADKTSEPNESFTVTLSDPSAGTSIATASANGTILSATKSSSAATPETTTSSLSSTNEVTLNGMRFIPLAGGPGVDTLTATGPGQILTGGAGADTLVGDSGYGDIFSDTSAGLDGDTIRNFGGSDLIDLTDLLPASVKPVAYADHGGSGTLSVTDGTHGAGINFTGSYHASNFAPLGSDGRGGTLFGYTQS